MFQQVSVKPAPSDNFELTPLSGNEYNSCLCGSERKTLRWTMIPSVLGKTLKPQIHYSTCINIVCRHCD